MEMKVEGKQIDVGDALRQHVTTKLTELDQKFFNHATDATVTFSREGHGHGLFKVKISMHIGRNIMVITEATEGDPRMAFDFASEKAAKRLRRYKTKLRDHHQRVHKTPESELVKARKYVLAMEGHQEDEDDLDGAVKPDGDPVVIAEMATQIHTMSVSDAVMRMELADQNAMLFRNASNNRLNVVFRRNDGNVGWIDPQE